MRYYTKMKNEELRMKNGLTRWICVVMLFVFQFSFFNSLWAQVTIGGSVYGGGNKATVTGAVKVDLEAGTVAKSVYGGGNQAGVDGTTSVTVTGGTVGAADEADANGVYGGCNQQGDVSGNVTVTVQGGTLGTSSKKLKGIFGGGYGALTTTGGDVTVTIGDTLGSLAKTPTLFADIYGGSALGSVNAAGKSTKVNFMGGTLHGNLYGGGLGKAGTDNVDSGKVNGTVVVNIGAPDAIQSPANCHITLTGCNIYGCNNQGGSPMDNVFVNVYKTAHTTTDAAGYLADDNVNGAPTYAIDQVFGGGHNANYTPDGKTATVTLFTCDNTVRRVFGGGDAAATVGVATTIHGGRFDDVFGGGNGEVRAADIGAGGTNITVHGGYINRLFGGSNTMGSINGPMNTTVLNDGLCGEDIKEFFGGSNKVPIIGDLITTIGCGTIFEDVYGGSNEADITGDVTLIIDGGTFVNVYGGSKGTETTPANIKSGSTGTKGNVTLHLNGGTIQNAFGGSNINGNIQNVITVNVTDAEDVDCPLILTNLYGGNNLAIYQPTNPSLVSPVVNVKHIKNGNSILGNVFGGGKGTESSFVARVGGTALDSCSRDNAQKGRSSSHPQVNIGDSDPAHYVKIDGNVYGGGELADIYGSTEVNLQNSHSHVVGNLFGAGKGYVGDSIGANVSNDATVNITGGRVQRNVYGGGELASVGTFVGSAGHNDIAAGTGTTTVNISGGIIGTDNENAREDNANGNVYGAGLGRVGQASAYGGTYHFAYYNYVNNSNVTIGGDAHVMGSVFGGADDGHVWNNTRVHIKGGTVGSPLAATDAVEVEGIGPTIYIGNVYGGGRGVDPADASTHHYSLTAGRVFGNTYVEVSGGMIHHDVYGGGSLASVGDTIATVASGQALDIMGNIISGQYQFRKADPDEPSGYTDYRRTYRVGDPVTGTGLAHVRITGGQIGTTGINEGFVFGSGRGMASAGSEAFVHMAFVHNTQVYIKDTTIAAESRSDEADVRGSVFGGGANGHVTQNSYVEVDAGTVGAKLSLEERRVDASGMPLHRIYRGNVYGSGRGIDFYEDQSLNNHLSKTAGRVYGNSEVLITGGTVRHSVFGGGSLASVGTYVEDNSVPAARKIHYIEGTGQAKVTMTGGRVGPKADDLIRLDDGTFIDQLTGSALTAAIAAAGYDGTTRVWKPRSVNTGLDLVDTHFYYLGSNEGFVYGSGRGMAYTGDNLSDYSEMAFTHNTIVDISGPSIVCGSVFGGGENGHVKFDTKVNIHGDARIGGVPLVSHHDTHAEDYDIESDGFWEGDGSHKILLTVAANEDEHAEDANGTGKTVYRGNVYGGGRGVDHAGDPTSATFSSSFSTSAGRVYGNTEVRLSENAQVFHNIFGGGSIASVGTYTLDADGTPVEAMTIYKYNEQNYNPANGTITLAQGSSVSTGNAVVAVSGGIVGRTGHNEGFVYGAGRGLAGSRASQISHLSYCDHTVVTVSDSADVRGSLFGGGMNGHVLDSTDVWVSGGFIGARPKRANEVLTAPAAGQVFNNSCLASNGTHYRRGSVEYVSGILATDTTEVDHYGRAMHSSFLGNVYGAGRGVDNYIGSDAYDHFSPTAGRVYGNTHVRITGGYISHNVYGGGSIASVGNYDLVTAAEAAGDYAYLGEGSFKALKAGQNENLSGRAWVEITGGHIGDNGINNGLVFGSSRGMAGSDEDLYKDLSYANITHVVIGGSAVVRGCVFGSGENGHVLDSTLVEVRGGSIGNGIRTGADSWANQFIGNVYGGGRGVDLTVDKKSSRTAGWVRGSTHVKISGGHVHNNVYGGGSMAAVGIDGDVGHSTTPVTTKAGRTWVDVTGGLVGTYVAPTYNAITGQWERSEGASYGNVFGAGRGRPGIGIVNGNDWATHTYVSNAVVRVNYSTTALPDVMAETPDGTQHIVGNVFGGGNNGHVNNSTYVRVTRGRVGSDGNRGFGSLEGNVFGGGRGEDTYETYLVRDGYYVKNSGQKSSIPYRRTDRSAVKAYYQTARSHNDSLAVVDSLSVTAGLVYGNTTVTVNGATASDVQVMHHVYGGGSMSSVGDYRISADGTSDSLTSPSGLCRGEIYRLTDGTGVCTVNIYGGTFGTYGRNNGMIFGGCRGLEGVPGSVYDSMAYFHTANVTVGQNKGLVNFDNPNPLITGSVYGGGENGHGVGNTTVTIHNGKVGNHDRLYDRTKWLEDSLEVLNAWVKANPSGTGLSDTLAKITAFTDEMNDTLDFLSYCGNVYGGGCGTDKYKDVTDGDKMKYNPRCGVVYGNTSVVMDGGYVERNVYGGGAMANTGRRVGTPVQHLDENSTFALSWPVAITMRQGTGNTSVQVSDYARVGYSGSDNGDIFGATRGEAGERYAMAAYANASTSSVTVNLPMPAGYNSGDTEKNIKKNFIKKYDVVRPLVAGSVYGGAENGHVLGNSSLTLQNGVVGHGLYGGGKGKGTYVSHELKHLTAGSDGHSSWQAGDDSSATVYSITAGKVYGNTSVTMQGGHVVRNIYGGGNLGSIGKGNYAGGYGDYSDAGYGERVTDAAGWNDTVGSGVTHVVVQGGTVGTYNGLKDDLPTGNVFGGCRGEASPNSNAHPRFLYVPAYFLGYVNRTHVTIGDASHSPRIYGSVYGGGQDGHVRFTATVDLLGGTVGNPVTAPLTPADSADAQWLLRGNLFGAGSGIGTYTAQSSESGGQSSEEYNNASGSVSQFTTVTVRGGTVYRNVYGGGSLAAVGQPKIPPITADPDSTQAYTRVFILGGHVGDATSHANGYGGNVFGACRGWVGVGTQFATSVYSRVNVSSGEVLGSVYGGGEIGQVKRDAYVNVTGGTVGNDVYGSGKGWASEPDRARVIGNTSVTMLSGTVKGNLYGGGELASVGTHGTTGTGTATVTVTGGTVGNAADFVYDAAHSLTHPEGGHVYGGSKGAVDAANSHWPSLAQVDSASVTVGGTARVKSAVYGGGEMGIIHRGTRVSVSGDAVIGTDIIDPAPADPNDVDHYHLGSLFGGGFGSPLLTDHPNDSSRLAVDLAGRVYGNTSVTLAGGQVLRNVYGGGNVASVSGVCHVEVTGGLVGPLDDDSIPLSGCVYGSGRGVNADHSYKDYCNVDSTRVSVSGGTVLGDVYGGGQDGHVLGNTYVYITTGAHIGTDGTSNFDGNVFGSGCGSGTVTDPGTVDEDFDLCASCGRVGGNVKDVMDGGELQGSILGGGRLALTGVDADGEPVDALHGNVDIEVSGGSLGNPDPVKLLGADWSVGDIFGSGKGDIDYYSAVRAGCVTNTTITVTGSPRIYGAIFGGGEMASVGWWPLDGTDRGVFMPGTGATTVTISGTPEIGTDREFLPDADLLGDWTIYETVGSEKRLFHTCTGNVYGGSQGDVDLESPAWVSMARSRTSTVTVNGGTVKSSVFGGSEQGTVAGDTRVIINGGTIGSQVKDAQGNFVRWFGDVYAAGYGSDDENEDNSTEWNDSTDARALLAYSATPATLAGRVFGDARVDILGGTLHGNVFGGGKMASVGYEGNTAKGNTLVNIGSADGSGSATIGGEVYGANNLNGTPFGNTQVNVYHTAHTTLDAHPAIAAVKVLTAPTGELNQADVEALGTTDDRFAIRAVYGGGNQAAHQPLTAAGIAQVHVYYCEENTVKTVYGGGNAANTQNNSVIVDGGRIYQVFGGGNGAGEGNPGANVAGTATTRIYGGLINEVFGGSNARGDIGTVDLEISQGSDACDLMVANTYGGGNEADGGGGVITVGCGTKVGSFYGGSRNANTLGDIILNVVGGQFENVYGGSKGSANKAANIDGSVTVNVTGGYIKNLFGGSDVNGNITGKITVNVDLNPNYNCPDGLRIDNVYGGGNMALYQPTAGASLASPEINIISESVTAPASTKTFGIKNVYGGGLGNGQIHSTGTYRTGYSNSSPVVNIGGLDKVWDATLKTLKDTVNSLNTVVNRRNEVYIRENVYGGGSAAPVEGNPTVVLYSQRGTHEKDWDTTVVQGTVFGGGYGPTAVVTGNTTVGVFGDATVVEGNVYGGGNAGILSGSTDVQVGFDRAFVASQPTVSVAADNEVTLYSATPGSTLHYTTDGSTPTVGSATYSAPFHAEAGVTIKALAVKSGYDNSLPSAATTVHLPAPVITLTGASATLAAGAHGPSGVTLRYTTDGTTPNTSSTEYTGAVTLTDGQTLKAIAIMNGYTTSTIASVTYTVNP